MATTRTRKIEAGSVGKRAPRAQTTVRQARVRRRVARKEHDDVAHALLRASSAFRRLTAQRVKEACAVTGIQADILLLLAAEPALLGNDLAEMAGVNASTISHALDAMEKRRLLTRKRCSEDRRIVHIVLTEPAKRIAENVLDITQGVMIALTAGMSRSDLQAMQRCLQQVAQNGQAHVRFPRSEIRASRKS
jgi:DNA-binding MarR family transcriptional regulator